MIKENFPIFYKIVNEQASLMTEKKDKYQANIDKVLGKMADVKKKGFLAPLLHHKELLALEVQFSDLVEKKSINNAVLHHYNRVLKSLSNDPKEKISINTSDYIYVLSKVYLMLPFEEIVAVLSAALSGSKNIWSINFTAQGKLKTPMTAKTRQAIRRYITSIVGYYGVAKMPSELTTIVDEGLLVLEKEHSKQLEQKEEEKVYYENFGSYYSNYTLRKMPEDINSFISVAKMYLDENELNYLISLIENKIKTDEMDLVFSYLPSNDEALYYEALDFLSQTDPQDYEHAYVKRHLNDFEAACSLLLEADNEEDIAYLNEELASSLDLMSLVNPKTRKRTK